MAQATEHDNQAASDMNDGQFKAFLDLLMVSDPWPLDDRDHRKLLAYANAESGKRGYDGWIHAFHGIDTEAAPKDDDRPQIVNYDAGEGVVEVDFGSKQVQFLDVPRGKVAAWVEAQSPGHYYIENIRGRYRYVVV